MEKLMLSLQAPDLSDFQLLMDYDTDDEGLPLPEPTEPETHAMEPVLRDLNVDALAHRIMSIIPSLQSLYLRVSFNEGGGTYRQASREVDQ